MSAAAHVVVEDLDAPGLAPDDLHHLSVVLRLTPGTPVTVTDGRGGWRACRFAGGPGSGSASRLEPDGDVRHVPRPRPEVTVAFAPAKGDRPEWAVQKLTELGVDRIVLLQSERSVVRWEPGPRLDRNLGRLRKVARQALMQSRGAWLPDVSGVVPFAEAAGWPLAVLAVPGASAGPDLVHPTVLVGPEGGWSPAERSCGLPAVGLGPGILRAETAAVAAGVLLSALRAGVVGPA